MVDFLTAQPLKGQYDPFSSLWDLPSLDRQRSLLGRISTVALSRNVDLYLYWGTLLGDIREERILPWDDDVDLALFEPARCQELRTALHSIGLDTWILRSAPHQYIKICDRRYSPTVHCPWTWPYVDIFVYSSSTDSTEVAWPMHPVPYSLISPGRLVTFEGAALREPEHPLSILDTHYETWRSLEITSEWNHRNEQENVKIYARKIQTDESGRSMPSF